MKSSLVLRPVSAVLGAALLISAFASACATEYAGEQNTAGTGGMAPTTGGVGPTGGSSGTAGNMTNGGSGGSVSAGNGGTSGLGGAGGTTGGTSGNGGTGGAGAVGGQAGSVNPVGGSSGTGGMSGAGGSDPSTGGGAGTAGEGASGGSAGAAAGTGGTGGSGGSGGTAPNTEGPCDIYEDADVPCVAAYSTVRTLRSAYTGPLYQLRRGGPDPNTGSGGEVQDINAVGGFADKAAHDAFCGTMTCTFATLYDQSGRGNNLTVAKGGCYEGTAAEDDYESDAKRRPTSVGGHDVYALYMDKHEGYRDNQTMEMPTGQEEQGVYMVAEGSGKRQGAGCCCCWNFGNASTDNCYGPSGQMNALFLGTGYWGKGTGSGPWFMGDFEAGVWAGGTGASNATNSMLPSMTMDYAFGILKSHASNYAIRVGNAQTGDLTTAYDGGIPTAFNGRWTMAGGIILGIGGDNSNSSDGTFLEGAITAGRPDNATDELVYRNVQALGYGQ